MIDIDDVDNLMNAELNFSEDKLNEIWPMHYLDQLKKIMKSLANTRIQADEMLQKYLKILSLFPKLCQQLLQYKSLINIFNARFTEQLAILLPRIRQGRVDHSEIKKLTEATVLSPFNPEKCLQWLLYKEKEYKELEDLLKNCNNIPLIHREEELQAFGLTTVTVFAFSFSFMMQDQPQLENMLKHVQFLKLDAYKEETPWNQDDEFLIELHSNAQRFKEHCEQNQSKRNIRFVLLSNNEVLSKMVCLLDKNDTKSDVNMWIIKSGVAEHLKLPSAPSQLSTKEKTCDSISLEWSPPQECGSLQVISYIVRYKNEYETNWLSHKTNSDDTCTTIRGLQSDTIFLFKIVADFDSGTQITNELSICTRTLPLPLAKRTMKNAKFIEAGPPAIYQINMCEVKVDHKNRVKWCSLGTEPIIPTKKKVLIVVGATGVGKTTLVNGMINYIFKVDWKDNFRFKLAVDEGSQCPVKSQTTWITAYTLYKIADTKINYTLTIIDTPGFCDASELKRDREIRGQIREMFTSKGRYSLDQLDGIGFVMQSYCPSHMHTKYIESILSLFGKDLSENIFIMTTFADGQRPPIMYAIDNTKMPYKTFFKFNNSALFVDSEDAMTGNFNRMFWEMGYNSFELFFKIFETVESKSLSMTRQVLTEHQQLEAAVIGLKDQVNIGLSKLEQMQEKERILLKHLAEIEANKNFTYTIEEKAAERVPIYNEFVTNCLKCNYTCHYPCSIAHDEQKYQCDAMRSVGQNAYCGVCPGRCGWRDHYNKNYRIEIRKRVVTKTAADMKRKYNVAEKGKLAVEGMVTNIEKALEYVHDEIIKKIKIIQRSLRCLDEIALKPNCLTETQYIELLIKSEEREAKAGYQDRIAFYKDALDQAKVMARAQSFDSEGSMRVKPSKIEGSKGWLEELTWWR